jgi:hypothetical protein
MIDNTTGYEFDRPVVGQFDGRRPLAHPIAIPVRTPAHQARVAKLSINPQASLPGQSYVQPGSGSMICHAMKAASGPARNRPALRYTLSRGMDSRQPSVKEPTVRTAITTRPICVKAATRPIARQFDGPDRPANPELYNRAIDTALSRDRNAALDAALDHREAEERRARELAR